MHTRMLRLLDPGLHWLQDRLGFQSQQRLVYPLSSGLPFLQCIRPEQLFELSQRNLPLGFELSPLQ
jgi:hypothetical protein